MKSSLGTLQRADGYAADHGMHRRESIQKNIEGVYESERIERIIHENELNDQNVSLRAGLCFWKQVWQ
jgi:hypothetical protein